MGKDQSNMYVTLPYNQGKQKKYTRNVHTWKKTLLRFNWEPQECCMKRFYFYKEHDT